MFPNITHIDQVIHAVDGNPAFGITRKDGYTSICYNYQADDVFPNPHDVEYDSDEYWRRKILRECRGILFNEDGNIIRRPLHKFFNYGQSEAETDDFTAPHRIVTKYDGSMIAPFKVNDMLLYGTKRGHTDLSAQIEQFVKENQNYNAFSNELIGRGYTPIFEWCSPKHRIVIDYKEDMLILIEIRHMITGEYMSLEDIHSLANDFNIPHAYVQGSIQNVDEFIRSVQNLKNDEGVIIRFQDGIRIKMKSDEYLAHHRAISDSASEKNILSLIMSDSLDDVLPALPEHIKEPILQYNSSVLGFVVSYVDGIMNDVEQNIAPLSSRKEQASAIMNDEGRKKIYPFYFKLLNAPNDANLVELYFKVFEKNLNSNTDISKNRHLIGNVTYKPYSHVG